MLNRQLLVLGCVVFAEPVSLFILYPFMYFLVKDFNMSEDERDIGFYVGLVAASFAIAQFFTSVPWGWISDRIGRRPVILIGLFGNFVTSVAFGFSKTYTWAIVSRTLCGLLNGNIGVAKCVLGEICDESNLSFGFSMFGFLFGLGALVAPTLGGLLAKPAEQYPSLFGNFQLFVTYPYLLPCLVSSLVSLFGFIVGFIYFEETLNRQSPMDDDDDILIASPEHSRASFRSVDNIVPIGSTDGPSSPGDSVKEKKALVVHDIIPSYESTAVSNMTEDQRPLLGAEPTNTRGRSYRGPFTTILNIVCQEVYVLWCQTDVAHGGLGWSTTEVGITMAIGGVILLLFQIFIYPLAVKQFGHWKLYSLSMLFHVPMLFVTVFMGVASQAAADKWGEKAGPILLWTLMCLHHLWRAAVTNFAFTSIMLMINNSVSVDRLAVVNGIGQMCAAGSRAMGPALGGLMWQFSIKSGLSWPLNNHFVFVVLALLALLTWAASLMIPKYCEHKNSGSSKTQHAFMPE